MTTKILSEKDVVQLLREQVERAGGQSAWARQNHVDRSYLNTVLAGRRPINPAILSKLKIKIAYVREN